MPTYPFIQAKHFYDGRNGEQPIWIVLHSAETMEGHESAEGIARGFAKGDRVASAHLSCDDNSTVRSVKDSDTAFGAKGANVLGLHLEHAGFARQTAAEWRDDFSERMLTTQSAPATALWVRERNIPIRFCDSKLLLAHQSGFTTHAQVSKAFPSTGHSDPGAFFPIDWYLARVEDLAHHHPQEDDMLRRVLDRPGDGTLWLVFCDTATGLGIAKHKLVTPASAEEQIAAEMKRRQVGRDEVRQTWSPGELDPIPVAGTV